MMAKGRPQTRRNSRKLSAFESQSPPEDVTSLRDLSKHFLSAAEADDSPNATGTADHLRSSNVSATSNDTSQSSSQPARRKENCAACAHLITRAGQPFQCRIFSVDYSENRVERREKIDLTEGHTCPYFMRITSKQIDDILKSHGSSLDSEQVREYAHCVDEQVIHNKTVEFSPRPGTSAEETLREELLGYLADGYSIVEATVTRQEDHSETRHSKTTTHKIRLRVKNKD